MTRHSFRYLGALAGFMVLFVVLALPAKSQQAARIPSVAAKAGEWRFLNGDALSTRYSPLDQVNKDTVKNLTLAWRWKADVPPAPQPTGGTAQGNGDAALAVFKSEATPLMVDGVLYTTAGGQRTVWALDAATGKTLWTWAGMDEGVRATSAPRRNAGRGVGYWTDGKEERIFVVTTGFYLVALDARTGVPVPTFGQNGAVDLMKELNVPAFNHIGHIGNSSPPMVYKDTVMIPSAGEEGFVPVSMRNTPGYVMAFDARTGKQKWAFHGVPKPGEFGADTWENESNTYTGQAGSWAPLSVDPELGYVYLPGETATDDYYGGHRLGSNLFANTLVCIDINTGKRVWHFQITHHDIWNYDLPNAPVLADVRVNGRTVKMVAQGSKQGFVYVFDRVTGKPIWPIVERPVPASDVPGERAWPTQPIPTKPAPYAYQGYNENDLIDFTPALRAQAIEILKPYRLGPVFTPPSQVKPNGTKGTLYNPGGTGGSVWESGAFDPETGILYMPSQVGPGIITVVKDPKSDLNFSRGTSAGRLTVQDLPILKPPYSYAAAIDLATGEHVFRVAVGDTPAYIKNSPVLTGLTIPRTGTPSVRPLLLVTKTLLFAGEGWGGGRMFQAFDKKTGALAWETTLPGMMGSMPMTYMLNGKQYIAFTVGDPTHPSELLAFTVGGGTTTQASASGLPLP